jgi:hypothetical protein
MAAARLLAWLLSAAMSVGVQASTGPGDKVLVLTRDPSVGVDVEKALRAWHQSHGRSDGGVEVDQRLLKVRQGEAELARNALAAPHRYRAVYVTTLALARAAQQVDSRVPVVFSGAADPTAMCLVDSPQHPGRNATGFTSYLPEAGDKMLEALLDGFPALRRVYILVGGSNVELAGCVAQAAASPPPGDSDDQSRCRAGPYEAGPYIERRMLARTTVEAGRRRNVDVRFLLLCEASDFALLRTIDSQRDDVGYMIPWQFIYTGREQQMVDLVASVRRPTIYGRTRFTALGGLMAIESLRDPGDERRAIDMLIQVLDGRSPATLPVQMPRGFRLTVNAVAAADMQLRPSLGLLRRADDVIARKP